MYDGGISGRGAGKILKMNKSNAANWIKKSAEIDLKKQKTSDGLETAELDGLYWFLEHKPQTETRENVYSNDGEPNAASDCGICRKPGQSV